jgi:hypothetical protein
MKAGILTILIVLVLQIEEDMLSCRLEAEQWAEEAHGFMRKVEIAAMCICQNLNKTSLTSFEQHIALKLNCIGFATSFDRDPYPSLPIMH